MPPQPKPSLRNFKYKLSLLQKSQLNIKCCVLTTTLSQFFQTLTYLNIPREATVSQGGQEEKNYKSSFPKEKLVGTDQLPVLKRHCMSLLLKEGLKTKHHQIKQDNSRHTGFLR